MLWVEVGKVRGHDHEAPLDPAEDLSIHFRSNEKSLKRLKEGFTGQRCPADVHTRAELGISLPTCVQ